MAVVSSLLMGLWYLKIQLKSLKHILTQKIVYNELFTHQVLYCILAKEPKITRNDSPT
jgi:hypothetical protein